MDTSGTALVNTQVGPAQAPVVAPVAPTTPTEPVVNPTIPPPANPGIVSSTQAQNTLDQGSADLDNMTNQPDPYVEYLQKQAAALANGTDTTNAGTEANDISTATTNAASLQNKVQSDYASYKAGLETLGIQSGLASMAPDLQAGRLLGAANDETTKIQDIQQKEDLAVAKAKQARINNDAVTLKDTNAEIEQIKKDKADAITQAQQKQTHDFSVANDLSTYAYKTLQTLDPDKQEAFILQTAKDNDISPAALTSALAKEQDTQTKFNLTTALQEKSLDKQSSDAEDKPLSPGALKSLAAENPLLDLSYGVSSADATKYTQFAKGLTDSIDKDFSDPANLGPQGYLTFAYGQKLSDIIDNNDTGVSKVALFTQLYDDGKITPSLLKNDNYKGYGLTEAEAKKVMGQ